MRIIALLLCLPLFAIPQDKSKKKLEWKAEAGSVLEYDVLDPKTNKPSGDGFFVFASELTKSGGNRIAVDRYEDLHWPFLFQLPKDEVKPGHTWEHTAYFFHESAESTSMWGWQGPGSIKPICGKGRYLLRKIEKKDDDEIAWIDGEFEFFEIRRDFVNNQLKLTVTKNKAGSLSTSASYSFTKGVITLAGWNIDLPRAQARSWEKDYWRVADRKHKDARRIEFKEAVKLDAEKMGKAIDAGAKKAVEWLRKQQKASGEFGTGRTMETERVDTPYTGLVLRALLAAGVKPDDDAVQKAYKSVRLLTGNKTPQTYDFAISAIVSRLLPGLPWADHKIESLRSAFQKNFPKEDLAAVKAAMGALLESRDPKLGGWAPGSKRGTDTQNPITTRHAAEGLLWAWLAGLDVSNEVWRSLLDLYVGTAVDDDDDVELDFAFVEGFQPLEADPKKVIPGSWKFNSSRRPDDNPMSGGNRETKGNVFTVLSVLEILATARAAWTVPDGQKKALDLALKKGLAYLQSRWTLRTPPPAEAAWSVQKAEYLCAMMRVFTALGIQKIGGADWHLEGAYLLLRQQYADGSWDLSGGSQVVDTACALLFLTRGGLRLPAKK